MNADPSGRRQRLVRGALTALLVLVAGLAALWFALPDPAAWSRANPTTTALIEQRRTEARAAGRRYQPSLHWVPLDQMSRRLVDAVVASEDAKFFGHGGFDWEALRSAFRHNLARGRYARGASTITQQLAKNLYLGTEKSLLRKGREALLSAKLERRLDKRRILALYLNVAEWGDGVFGADAGARRHFGTGAASLTTAQAVVLAAMLPAPGRGRRGLLARLLDEQVIPPAEHETARAELERYLGRAPVPGDEEAEPPPDEETTEPPPGAPTAALTGTPAADPAATPASDPAEGQEAAPARESPPVTVAPNSPEPAVAAPDSPASPAEAAPTPASP
jgi:monofunctional biosynthetic peptidoglycan transglycosylase